MQFPQLFCSLVALLMIQRAVQQRYCNEAHVNYVTCVQQITTAWMTYRNARFLRQSDQELLTDIRSMQQLVIEMSNAGLLCQMRQHLSYCSQNFTVSMQDWVKGYQASCGEYLQISQSLRPLTYAVDSLGSGQQDTENYPFLVWLGLTPYCDGGGPLSFFLRLPRENDVFLCMHRSWAERWRLARRYALESPRQRSNDELLRYCQLLQTQYVLNWQDSVSDGALNPVNPMCFPDDTTRYAYCRLFANITQELFWKTHQSLAACNFGHSFCEAACSVSHVAHSFDSLSSQWSLGCQTLRCRQAGEALASDRFCALLPALNDVPLDARQCPFYLYSLRVKPIADALYGDTGFVDLLRPRPTYNSLYQMANNGCQEVTGAGLRCILKVRQESYMWSDEKLDNMINRNFWGMWLPRYAAAQNGAHMCSLLQQSLLSFSYGFYACASRPWAAFACDWLAEELLAWQFNWKYTEQCKLQCPTFDTLPETLQLSRASRHCMTIGILYLATWLFELHDFY